MCKNNKNNKKLFSSIHLKAILKEKDYELEDLKAEIILIVFENFIKHYIDGEINGRSELLLKNEGESPKENSFIFTKLNNIRDELLETNSIHTIDSLQDVASKSLLSAAKYSPYTLLYNMAIQTFVKEKDRLFKGIESKKWTPDVLAVYLIIDAKENGISFSKFPIIERENFEDILNIYSKTNIKLKKMTDEKMTIITKTSSIASLMIDKIIKAK